METIVLHLAKSTGLALLFIGSYYLFLRKETFFSGNRIYLLSGVVVSLLFPFFTITKTISLEMQPVVANNINYTENSAMVIEDPFNWVELLIPVYFIGFIFFSSKLALQFIAIKRVKKTSKIFKEDDITHVQSTKNLAPFSFFKSIFYCPNQFKEEELRPILTHEKIHVRQYHTLDVLFMELMCIIFWFNPIVFIYKKLVKQNLEFLADAQTMKLLENKKLYQYLLLQQAVGHHQFAIANPFFNSLIKKRIVMINQNPSSNLKALKSLFILPLLGLFLVSFNIKTEYVYKNITEKASPDNIIELIIDKTTSDEQLMKMKADLKKDNIDFSYTTVRNNEGEISALSIQLSGSTKKGAEFSSSHNSQSDNDTISPTYIFIDTENNSISIGNSQNSVLHQKDHSNVWIHKTDSDEEDKEIIIKKINGKKQIIIDGKEATEEELKEMGIDVEDDAHFIISKDKNHGSGKKIVIRESVPGSKKQFIIKSDTDEDHDMELIEMESDGFFFMDLEEGKKPLFYVNGKKSTMEDVKKLDKSTIKSMDVRKGDGAVKEYGKEAKNGVIEIITKNNNSENQQKEGFQPMLIITSTSTKENTQNQLAPFKDSPFNLTLEEFRTNEKGIVTKIKIGYTNKNNERMIFEQENSHGIETVYLDAKFNDKKVSNPSDRISDIKIYSSLE